MDERRTARVSEAVREELSEIIAFELEDPHLRAVQVTAVQVSSDMRSARVKVAIEGPEKEQRRILKSLDHASSFLKLELANRLDLRKVPDLHFAVEKHPEAPERVDLLLKRAQKSRGLS